jgi:hypothetical protein
MADETPPPLGVPGQPERRRPAPTIDLQATEIASGAEQTSASEQSPPDHDAAATMPPPSAAHRYLSELAAAVSWPLVGAGLAGAILTLGIVWVVVALGVGQGNDSSAADARIGQLERQVADLAARAGPNAASAVSTGDLASRLQKLESQVGQMAAAPALANRIAAVEAQLKSLTDTAGVLGRRGESNAAALSELNQKLARAGAPESNATPNEASNANAALIAALAARLDALEGSAKTAETTLAVELAKRDTQNADDRSVRTAIVAAALAAAVERGRPFAAELKAAQAQAADAQVLAPLEAFAAAGVPNANALTRELSGLEPALLRAAGTASPEGGFLEKLQAHAERLVRIRPIEEIAGDDPAAVIARVEIKAARGDLPGALVELDKLPAPVRAPAQGWIFKTQTRTAALAASRTFAADALAALAKPSR